MAKTNQTLGYRAELDGFRALAILAVLAFHTEWAWYNTHHFGWGWRGVDLFFVLSGFLITSLLTREHRRTGRIDRRRFYGRRAARLLPALCLALVVGAVIALRYGNGPWTGASSYPQAALATLFFAGNWMGVHKLGMLGHTWSLGLEEQYYLVWPAAVAVALRRNISRAKLAAVVGGLAFVVAASRWAQDRGHLASHWSGIDLRALSRSDGILIGSALALLLSATCGRAMERALRDRRLAAAALICAAVLAARPSALHMRTNDTVLPLDLCFAVLIGHAFVNRTTPFARALRAKPLPGIGRISYGLYLFHWPIFVLAIHSLSQPLLAAAAAWTGSFAVACASFVLVERPLRALGKRVGKPRSTTQEQPRRIGQRRLSPSPAIAAASILVLPLYVLVAKSPAIHAQPARTSLAVAARSQTVSATTPPKPVRSVPPTSAPTAAPTPVPTPLMLYVFAGQSNMIDAVTSVKALASVDPALGKQPDVLFWGPTEDTADKRWVPLAAPTEVKQAYSHEGFGPEIGAAPLLARRHRDTTVAIVKLSRSATSLAGDWSPRNPAGLYPKLLADVRTAKLRLERQTDRLVRVAGFFWLQGESDAQFLDMAQAYAKNLTAFIKAVRADLRAPQMPFVIGEIPELKEHYPAFRYCSIVQAAQREVARGDARAFYVPTADLELSTSSPAHFSTRGIVDLGRRFVNPAFPL